MKKSARPDADIHTYPSTEFSTCYEVIYSRLLRFLIFFAFKAFRYFNYRITSMFCYLYYDISADKNHSFSLSKNSILDILRNIRRDNKRDSSKAVLFFYPLNSSSESHNNLVQCINRSISYMG